MRVWASKSCFSASVVRTTIAAAAGREAEAAAALPFLECLETTTTAEEEEEDRFNDDDFCNGTPCGARRTLSCRSASAFAPWTVVSHFAHKYASSAAQYHRALCIPHTSHARLALPAIAIAVACTLLVVMIIFFFFVAISLPDVCSRARSLPISLFPTKLRWPSLTTPEEVTAPSSRHFADPALARFRRRLRHCDASAYYSPSKLPWSTRPRNQSIDQSSFFFFLKLTPEATKSLSVCLCFSS